MSTPHLEQLRVTPHTAFPTVSFPSRSTWPTEPSAPPRLTSFAPLAELRTRQGELQVEILKHETKAFSVECRNKIEDEMRGKMEKVTKLELTHPLYLLQQARSENNKPVVGR